MNSNMTSTSNSNMTSTSTSTSTSICDYRNGFLPSCAPLVFPYVPPQQPDPKVYTSGEALNRGTLFPGLDLPFMNKIAIAKAMDTPLAELMALGFVVHELGLYLDTHATDAEAFDLFKEYAATYAEARAKYVTLYGPITQIDAAMGKTYTWINDPWPWEYRNGKGEK